MIPRAYYYPHSSRIVSINLRTACEYGIFLLQANTVSDSSFGYSSLHTSSSLRQKRIAPLIVIGYPKPCVAMIAAFVVRLLTKAAFNFRYSSPNQLASSLRIFLRSGKISGLSKRSSFVICSFSASTSSVLSDISFEILHRYPLRILPMQIHHSRS